MQRRTAHAEQWGRWASELLRRFGRARASQQGADAPVALAAATAARCAALLRGGMSPALAVQSLARDIDSVETREVARLVREGSGVGDAVAHIDGPEWRVLGAAWNLAEGSGAPFAPALDRIAAAFRGIVEVTQKREVLLAGPRLTARLVSWLPVAAVVVSFLLGFDPLPVFVTPFGVALLIVGLLLQIIGMRWTRVLTSRVVDQDRVAGLECELMWIALAGGAPPQHALRRVADAVTETGAEWIAFDSLRAGRPLASALATATTVGVPASTLLLDAAGESRARTQAQLEREAERLGIRILVPLATCVLPAFIAIGVVPVIVTLLGDLLPM